MGSATTAHPLRWTEGRRATTLHHRCGKYDAGPGGSRASSVRMSAVEPTPAYAMRTKESRLRALLSHTTGKQIAQEVSMFQTGTMPQSNEDSRQHSKRARFFFFVCKPHFAF